MASAETVCYPAHGQGVRIIVDNDELQVTAAVETVDEAGALTLRVRPGADLNPLEPERHVTLQYFRGGTLYNLRSVIERVRSAPREESGSVTWLDLAVPRGARSVRRRRFPRVNVDVPVRFVRAENPEGIHRESLIGRWTTSRVNKRLERDAHHVRTAVLGAGGMRMVTNEPLQLDDGVFVELDIPLGACRLAGRVVWVGEAGEPAGVGVEFVEVSEEVRYEINRFVRNRAAQLQSFGGLRGA